MANKSVQQRLERERRAREAAEEQERLARSRPTRNFLAPVVEGAAKLRRPAFEALSQADTAMRTVANTLTFGAADKLDAGLDSLFTRGNLSGYGANLGANRARNQYDATHRRNAQVAGEIGAATLMLGRAPLRGIAAKAPERISSAVKVSKRELGALAAGGGLTNAAIQNFTDATMGRRPTWQNGVSSFAGGATGVLAYPLGAQRAGAVGGAVASATQDLLNGRQVDFRTLAQNATVGRLAGGLGGAIGKHGSNALSSRGKGKLGETLGALRSDLNGMPIEPGPKKLELRTPGARKGGTIADGRSGDVRFEYKFGPKAELTRGQLAAQALLGDKYKVYQFLPEDVGNILSIPALGIGRQLYDDQWR